MLQGWARKGRAMKTEALYVGVDVSKTHLDVAVCPTGEVWRASNDEAGINGIKERLATCSPAPGGNGGHRRI